MLCLSLPQSSLMGVPLRKRACSRLSSLHVCIWIETAMLSAQARCSVLPQSLVTHASMNFGF